MKNNSKADSKGKKTKSKATQQVKSTVLGVVWGDVLTSQFFRKHSFAIILIIVLTLIYITFKYECQTKMETIAKLETELSILQSESIREHSTYKSSIRESAMQQRIDSLNLQLKVQDQPPYILNY